MYFLLHKGQQTILVVWHQYKTGCTVTNQCVIFFCKQNRNYFEVLSAEASDGHDAKEHTVFILHLL